MENLINTDINLPPACQLNSMLQSARWFAQPIDLLKECYKDFGDAFTLDLSSLGKYAFFSDPKIVSDILKANATVFYSSQDKAFMESLFGRYSLFILENEAHLQRRRMIAPTFHHHKIQAYGEAIKAITLKYFSTIDANNKLILQDHMLKVSLQMIFQIVFGLDDDKNSDQIKVLIESMLKLNRSGAIQVKGNKTSPAIQALQNRFESIKTELDDKLKKLIDLGRGMNNSARNDMLSLLLNVQDENNNALTTEEIKDHLITILIAGHETTATALTWAIYWIHTNKSVLQRLQNECDQSSSDISMINSQIYLQAVCQETLRIMPVLVIIARTLKIPMHCGDYTIPAKMNIAIPIYLLHHNPSIYPNPEAFQPERFLERKFQFNEYMPFGGGTRICIGMNFALYQMKIILATLLNHFSIELHANVPVQPVRKSVVISPAEGLVVEIFKRDNTI